MDTGRQNPRRSSQTLFGNYFFIPEKNWRQFIGRSLIVGYSFALGKDGSRALESVGLPASEPTTISTNDTVMPITI